MYLCRQNDRPQGQLVIALLTLCVMSWGLSTGCAPTTHQQAMTFLKGHRHTSAGEAYRLAPPDKVRVEAPQAPEVEGTYRIQPDGTIQNRLLGNVRVVGLTTHEAAAKLQKLLSHYYRDPVVHMSLNQQSSKVLFMFGEVRNFGAAADRGMQRIPLTGQDTILNVLTANPPSQNAWLSQVKVIRPNPENPEINQEIRVDVQKLMVEGDMTHNIYLQEGDIVVIPPTVLAWMGHRVRELLQPVSPVLQAYSTPAAFEDVQDRYDTVSPSPDRFDLSQ